MSKIPEHTQAKQKWLGQRLKSFNTKQSSSGITAQPRPPNLPLSFAQQRLWFLEQWEPGSTAYLLPYAWRLQGPLDLAVLEASLTAFATRHESLRTTFAMVDGHPVQVIAPVAPVSLPVLDLTSFSASTRNVEVQRLIQEDAHQPFDLTTGPLWRAQLLRLGSENHALLLSLHHIITDGWSMGILFQELSALYTANITGQTATLAPLPIQYADFAIWQRQWLQGDVLNRQLTYWQTQLADAPPYLDISTDAPRPLQQTYRGDRLAFTLPPSLTQALKTLSQQEGVTLFMTLLAAFQILLARYAGQRDILVGTPIAGRTHTELENLIGFFVNTLVLRVRFQSQPTFLDVLRQVRDTCLEAYAHQDLPFEKLVEVLKPVRDPSRHPFFQVMFQLHHAKLTGTLTLPHVQVKSLSGTSQTAKFDLSLSLVLNEERLQGSFTFNSDLFTSSTISRLALHYQTLLEGLVTDPGRDVFQRPLLTEAERHQILSEWNETTEDYPRTKCLHELFEEQVTRTPEAMAVVFEEQQLTYRELNERANQLAHFLRGRGVGPDVRVGICLDRGLELIISLLGILKAGGAYVPLDPTYPEERLHYIVNDAAPQCILTQHGLVQGLEETDCPRIYFDEAEAFFAQWPRHNPVSAHTGLNLAYLIYTSGSTGRPKGVMVQHEAVVNLLLTLQERMAIDPTEVVLAVTNYSFDISVFELLGPLIAGSRLVLASREVAMDGAALLTVVESHGITILQATPTSWYMLLQASHPSPPKGSLKIISGGEPMSPGLAHRLQPWGTTIWNAYGPTETTIWSTIWKVKSPEDRNPIGRPLANTSIFLVDKLGELAPIGVPGELLIGGDGVTRGYQLRPDLTAEKFIPDPFSSSPGKRLYKTGDLVRYRLTGDLEYLERLDHQVKLRGYRIELGEIEKVLGQYPEVQNVVVLCREDSPGEKQLVAYVVAASEIPLDPVTLRTYLKTQIPDYMLPAAFVVLEAFPLTSSGKINRRALPVPDQSHRARATAYAPPRTPLEEMLVEIWQDLLKVDHISVHDNFFELGGHSLLATQVVARIRTFMLGDLTVRTFFDGPTIGQLSDILQATHSQTPVLAPPPLHFQQQDGPRPLSFAQQRLWFLEQWEPGSTAYLLPYAWRLQGPLDLVVLEASLTALATRHESLRTSFAMVDGHPVQVIAPVASVSVPVLDLTSLPASTREGEVQRLVHEDAHQPFDLTIGPLWRGQLLRMTPEEHVLLLTLHHIITDGWSMGIMFQEMSALYAAQVTGQPATLPSLPIQYADFAVWQRQWLQGDMLDRQLAYWRTQLAETPLSLELPTDTPRPLQQTYRGNRISFTLPPSLTQALKALSQQEGVTLFMTLLATFQILLARYTGQADILVGTPIAGRTHTELESLIGFFVNTLVLRVRFQSQPTFREVLQQVRETCLNAYAHQDVPFEKLVEDLKPVRDPSRHPFFQVMFQLHLADSSGGLTLPSMEIVKLAQTSQTAKFDLSLSLALNEERLQGSFTFNSDLFTSSTISRLALHYQTLLEGLVTDPGRDVFQLPLLTGAERHQLLVEWNPPFSPDQASFCVHHLFEKQAARTPEAIAVVYEDQQISYQELNERANQLAHYLIRQGIGLDTRVGVYLERSLAMVVGLLGILKAGGAYVPLDLTTPPDRIRFMLQDAGVAMVITSAILRSRIATGLNSSEDSFWKKPPVLVLDMKWPSLTSEDLSSALPPVLAENLAYVMYTSGSTGQPKGVGIPHRGVVRLVRNPKYLKWPTPAIFFQLASPAFDAATFEIWACLVNGGKLVLGPTMLPSLDELGTLLQEQQITILWLTAGLFHQMVDWNIKALSPLQTLLVGGDILSPRHVRRVAEQLSTCQLINGYGPTENTTFTCCFPIPPDVDVDKTVPIGRPLNQTQVYVLDAQQHLVPNGVTGELCIGGLGLGREYHGRPELTAEKFIPHPFSPVPGDRLYRSGDLVRYRPDGTLEFLGRRDHQVKIRGYRIECGEIEMILTTHPAVREVVVLPREDSAGNKRLVAYIVPESESTPNISDLQDFLIRTLPSYMIPAGFVFLDTFPLTPNGKVDQSKLPVEDQRSSQEEGNYVAPRNSLESQLTKIWETVLEREPIGVTDNFFNLGGESLMALRLCSEIERALQRKIPVPLIFHAQTIEQLAQKIGHGEENERSSLMVPIQTSGSNPPIFCVCFGDTFRPFLKNYPNQPLYMFFNQGYDGKPAHHTTVEEIARLYLKDMRTVQTEGPFYLAGYSFGGLVAYEMAQQLHKQGEIIGLLALVDPTSSLSQTAPLKRGIHISSFTTEYGKNQGLTCYTSFFKAFFTKTLGAFQWRLMRLKNTARDTFKKMACRVFFAFGYDLPTSLRRDYCTRVVQGAARQYIPQNYHGQIVIFQTNNRAENYWSKLCAEVEQVYDFQTGHLDIVKGPHTQTILPLFMDRLEKAQKKHS
jgi:amino acid adenylation domain-containing protein